MNFQHIFAYKCVPIFPVSLFFSIFLHLLEITQKPPVYDVFGHALNTFLVFFFTPSLSNTGLEVLNLDKITSTDQLRGEITRQSVTEGQHLGLLHINEKLQRERKVKGWEGGFWLFQTVTEDKKKFCNALVIFSVLIYAYQSSVSHFMTCIMTAKCLKLWLSNTVIMEVWLKKYYMKSLNSKQQWLLLGEHCCSKHSRATASTAEQQLSTWRH